MKRQDGGETSHGNKKETKKQESGKETMGTIRKQTTYIRQAIANIDGEQTENKKHARTWQANNGNKQKTNKQIM